MEHKTLKATERQGTGKGRARALRREGLIPAVVYGHTEPKSIAVDAHEFATKFHAVSESTIISLKLDKHSHDVLIRDFQEDCVSGKVIHVDFYEIERGRVLRTNVALQLSGAPIGVREGGLLESFVHEVEVECLPKDLPERIVVDVAGLELSQSIHIRDVATPEGVKILNPPDQVVCTVAHKRVEEKPEAAEEEALAEAAEAAAAAGEEAAQE
ncbi:MAG: 50S ribosomal protein L25 [Spirochaetales bacterium]|nr:50S ribosomal protein L25 [Spirochaetales bacterium]